MAETSSLTGVDHRIEDLDGPRPRYSINLLAISSLFLLFAGLVQAKSNEVQIYGREDVDTWLSISNLVYPVVVTAFHLWNSQDLQYFNLGLLLSTLLCLYTLHHPGPTQLEITTGIASFIASVIQDRFYKLKNGIEHGKLYALLEFTSIVIAFAVCLWKTDLDIPEALVLSVGLVSFAYNYFRQEWDEANRDEDWNIYGYAHRNV